MQLMLLCQFRKSRYKYSEINKQCTLNSIKCNTTNAVKDSATQKELADPQHSSKDGIVWITCLVLNLVKHINVCLIALVSREVIIHICERFAEMNTKLHIYDPLHVMNLPYSLDICACMVGLFYSQTPRRGTEALWENGIYG